MAIADFIDRLYGAFSTDKATNPPNEESLSEDDYFGPELQQIEELINSDSFPEKYKKPLKTQCALLEHVQKKPSHWERVHATLRSSPDQKEGTPRQELRETKRLAQSVRDAFDADYRYYAKWHHLAEESLSQFSDVGIFEDEDVDPVKNLSLVSGIFKEFAMTNSWVASIRYRGLRLMFLNPDDEFGNLVLDHEVKRQTSELILSTTTVVETVGQSLLETHGVPVRPKESLASIIDKLGANDLITREETETMHSVRNMRNRVAHNMRERTSLDWVDDFQELVLDCFSIVDAVEYPLRERLETELRTEIADEYIELLSPAFEDDTDWESSIQQFSFQN